MEPGSTSQVPGESVVVSKGFGTDLKSFVQLLHLPVSNHLLTFDYVETTMFKYKDASYLKYRKKHYIREAQVTRLLACPPGPSRVHSHIL